MKRIQFNGKDYDIPQEWSDVNVGMLIKSSELAELLNDAPVVAIISAYTGIPIKELKSNKAVDVQDIMETMFFISKDYKPVPKTSFTLDGITYKCEEDIVNQKFEDWVSVQTALYNFGADRVRALPRILAIMCKKEGETLDDFNLDERTELFNRVSMTDAKDIEAFFLHLLQAYKSVTLLSSTQDVQKEIVLHKVQELSDTLKTHKGQTGIFSGTRLRIGIYQLQLLWVKKQLEKYFNLQHTNNSKKNWMQTCKNCLTRKQRGKRVKHNGKVG